MAQFDIHRYNSPAQGMVHYVVVLNHDFADLDGQKVVAPCYRAADYGLPITRLNFETEIEGTLHIIVVQELTSVARRLLGPMAGSASHLEDDIKRALDFLFSGF